MTQEQNISISLWFDNKAKEALTFYASIFPNSQVLSSNPVVTEANLSGVQFVGINGGPVFTPNPSISLMYTIENEEELIKIWNQLTPNGKVLMELGSYPWSAKYGWVEDKYHVSWQLYLGKLSDVNQQSIAPTLMFTQKTNGLCEEALSYYNSIFKNFQLQGVMHYADGDMKGLVQHTQFIANNFTFMAMDGGLSHNFAFNEGLSFVISCENQDEIDYYWNAFTNEGAESQCGWCKDKYGVSWQIIPKNIHALLQSERANQELMKMKKIIIKDLV